MKDDRERSEVSALALEMSLAGSSPDVRGRVKAAKIMVSAKARTYGICTVSQFPLGRLDETYRSHEKWSSVGQRRYAPSLRHVPAGDDIECVLSVSSSLTRRPEWTYLSITVKKVVLDITHDTLVSIFEVALLCPLARPGVVGLERARPRISIRDRISMVRPDCMSAKTQPQPIKNTHPSGTWP